jgi:hypothetical protein
VHRPAPAVNSAQGTELKPDQTSLVNCIDQVILHFIERNYEEEKMITEVISGSRVHQWGGAAFALGNVLFIVNKLNEMSRLFLSRSMPDVISGQNPALILVGQVALIIGYVAYYQFYAQRVRSPGKNALRLFSGGGIVLAFGHISFMSVLAEPLFLLVIIGLLFVLIGLIWFGILNLRWAVLSRWRWLPLATGLMGFIGFFLLSGQEITATFLFFRTLFALGLIGLGVILSLEKPVQPEMVR